MTSPNAGFTPEMAGGERCRAYVQLLHGQNSRTNLAARAATYGAINEVRISVREALLRDVAQYGTLLEEFQMADPSNVLRSLEEEALESSALNDYFALLSRCLSERGSVFQASNPSTDRPFPQVSDSNRAVVVNVYSDTTRAVEALHDDIQEDTHGN